MYIVQDKITVEDEHEGQNGRADIIHEPLDSRGDGVRFGNGRGGVGSQTHRWRVIGQNAEVKAEKVGSHQRNDEVVHPANLNDSRRCE